MMNGLQTLPQWRDYFNRPSAPVLGAINAIYPVSKILGLLPVSWMSDKWGRKLPMWIGLVIMLVGPAIQAASNNLAMFVVSRAIVGVATVFLALPCPILVAELSYPTHRGKITALYNTFFFVGAIAAAWVTYGTFRMASTWAWRIPSALQAAIPFFQFLGVYWVPESPRLVPSTTDNMAAASPDILTSSAQLAYCQRKTRGSTGYLHQMACCRGGRIPPC